jgi:hypothetical protein
MRKALILATLALGALMFAAAGSAHPKRDHAKRGTFTITHTQALDPTKPHGPPMLSHSDTYGPFAVTSTDNGCSGSPWATDTLNRTFVVKHAKATKNPDGTTSPNWRVWVFDRGTFTTTAGASPGSCGENATDHGSSVSAGKTGKLHGWLAGVVSGGTYDPAATCTGDTCGSTDVFVATYFGSAATFSCAATSTTCKFDFEYAAAPGQQLAFRHWSDTGTGAGSSLDETFKGDVADAASTTG